MATHQGPPPQDILLGKTVGNYLVTQKLGEGGMGSVYLAEHPTIGKKVALKVLHAEYSNNSDVTQRFFNEAKAVNDIGHPNIVDIVDYGILPAGDSFRQQLVYFIMEYIAGQTLSQLIRAESPMAPERALSIALQVADALAASHKCGIVHRDLKPDNIILMQRHRERDFVKLLDFGIAKLTNDSQSRTRTGLVMGTPAYMSPEQCEGRGSIDHRTDVYALGIVLYEMLTGRVPFIGEAYGDILIQHLTQPPRPPSQVSMMPPHVEIVVLKALEKRPDMRYPTMDEMMRAMADPVGYVEAHGGIQGFLQRQLMPSSAPLPPVRMTPAPLTAQSYTPTPAPGSIPVTNAGMYAVGATPTSMGTSPGQPAQGQGKSKLGLIIAGVAVIVAATAAIVVVLSKNGDQGGTTQPASAPDAAIIAQATDAAAAPPPTVDAAAIPAGTPDAADVAVVVDAGAVTAEAIDAGASAPIDAGTVAATPPDAGVRVRPPPPDAAVVVPSGPTITLNITTDPPNAKIYVDSKYIGKKTSGPFTLPAGKPYRLKFELNGRVARLTVDGTGNITTKVVLLKEKSGTGTGTGSGNDSGLMRPE